MLMAAKDIYPIAFVTFCQHEVSISQRSLSLPPKTTQLLNALYVPLTISPVLSYSTPTCHLPSMGTPSNTWRTYTIVSYHTVGLNHHLNYGMVRNQVNTIFMYLGAMYLHTKIRMHPSCPLSIPDALVASLLVSNPHKEKLLSSL